MPFDTGPSRDFVYMDHCRMGALSERQLETHTNEAKIELDTPERRVSRRRVAGDFPPP